MAPLLGRLGNGGGTTAGFGFGRRRGGAVDSRQIIFTARRFADASAASMSNSVSGLGIRTAGETLNLCR